jgi:hypothetical protein
MRIVVAGSLAAAPWQGGASWAVLQYVLGFEQLGHSVLLLEPAATDPAVTGYFERVVRDHGLVGRAAVLHADGSTFGMPRQDVLERCRDTDLLVNLGGVLRRLDLIGEGALRVYVDLDPGFTQCWQSAEGVDMNLDGHDRHATVGLTLGAQSCPVPTLGLDWITTLPPVVLSLWPVADRPPRHGMTTVGNWRSYGSVSYCGMHLGQKAHSVRRLLDLPALVDDGVAIEPALGIDPGDADDLRALDAHGWRLHDPRRVAGDTRRYRCFVRASRGEIGFSKSGYVTTRCGWVSDRSACYLASGRPVVVQDTGWTDVLPHGEGLLAFDDAPGAADAVHRVTRDYDRHRRAARRIAEEHFDSRTVLTRLLDETGAS